MSPCTWDSHEFPSEWEFHQRAASYQSKMPIAIKRMRKDCAARIRLRGLKKTLSFLPSMKSPTLRPKELNVNNYALLEFGIGNLGDITKSSDVGEFLFLYHVKRYHSFRLFVSQRRRTDGAMFAAGVFRQVSRAAVSSAGRPRMLRYVIFGAVVSFR